MNLFAETSVKLLQWYNVGVDLNCSKQLGLIHTQGWHLNELLCNKSGIFKGCVFYRHNVALMAPELLIRFCFSIIVIWYFLKFTLDHLRLPGCREEDREHQDRRPRQAFERRRHPRLWQNWGGEAVCSGQGVTLLWGGRTGLGDGRVLTGGRLQGSCSPSSDPSGFLRKGHPCIQCRPPSWSTRRVPTLCKHDLALGPFYQQAFRDAQHLSISICKGEISQKVRSEIKVSCFLKLLSDYFI